MNKNPGRERQRRNAEFNTAADWQPLTSLASRFGAWIYFKSVSTEMFAEEEHLGRLHVSVLDPSTGRAHDVDVPISSEQPENLYQGFVRLASQKGYTGAIDNFDFNIPSLNRNREDFLTDCPPDAGRLPAEPAKWPGLRRGSLVDFLKINYGRYIGVDLTMEQIKRQDPELYKCIYYYRKHYAFPFDIPARPQLLNARLEKFFREGQERLSAEDREAIGRKQAYLHGKPIKPTDR